MSKLKSYTKHKPCPICGAKDGCKYNSKGLTICRRCNTKADTPNGFVYLGTADRNPDWGLYLDEEYSTPYERHEQRTPPFLLRDFEPESLSLSERSAQYKKITHHLEHFHPDHIEWLKMRGFPQPLAQYLCNLGMRTYLRAFNRLPDGLSPFLPGLNYSSSPVLCQDGLLLPMLDWDGFILGFQVVPHQRITKVLKGLPYDGPKYCWLSNEGDARLPAPYHSFPHGFFTPPVNRDPTVLLLTEGALKGAVTAYLSGHYVLSTANGGRFNQAQLTAAIRAKGIKTVVLCPDAGMLNNELIAKAYFEVLAMVESLGVAMAIEWWDQVTKADMDIDELLLAELNHEES